MRSVLLDTHAFLWFVFDDPRLSDEAARIIEHPETTKHVSTASLWEIVVKSQLGKLRLGMPIEEFFAGYVSSRDLEVVTIDLLHLVAYHALPLHHRDPFDRLLVAQASVMALPIVTSDDALAAYGVDVLW